MLTIETRYATSENIHIAYQVVGDGPIDLVFVPGWISHVEYNWDSPQYARFLTRLASFSRLIIFDKRGTGLSDRVAELPTLEQRMDDVRAVMDAVGSRQAVIMGASEGGNMSALFAATYPERTRALIIFGSYAKRIWSPDYPWAPTPEERQTFFDWIIQDWGGVVDVDILAPSMAHDEGFRRWFATYLRRSASPGAALTLAEMNTQIDMRPVLPTIHVPTLVLNRVGDLDVKVAEAQYIASQIPGAQLVELPGDDHLWWVGDVDRLLNEVESFLINARQIPEPQQSLVTVLVLAALNDASGSDVHAQVAPILPEFRGREIAADQNALAFSFDGPTRALRCAHAIRDRLRSLGLASPMGIHTGECEIRGNHVSGFALITAHRIAAQAESGEILVSNVVKDLVAGSGLRFDDLGAEKVARIVPPLRLYKLADDRVRLTERELEILRLMADGATNHDIAARLILSEHTVHRHVANIFNKLDISSRTAAVSYAHQHHLL